MKNKGTSFNFLIIIYSGFLALVVTPLFGAGVAVSVYTGGSPHIIGWLMMILLFVLSFIVNYLVLTYLFTYISKLTRAIKQVANGDFGVRLKNNKLNPFDSTFSDFNQMVSELNSTKVMREDFISKFSHEFKTPITSINGFADLLLNEKLSKDKQKEYLKIIVEESKRLSKLSTQIMKLTNLENKEIVTNKVKIEIDEELRETLIALLPAIEEKELKYELNLQKVSYCTDPELLKEVWINLLSNSIKFTPKKGTIFVSCAEKDHKIEVVIGNTGPQLSDEEKEKIFNKFYQANHQNQSLGLGLGLTVVKQSLEILEGKITVETSYHNVKGTFFRVTLGRE